MGFCAVLVLNDDSGSTTSVSYIIKHICSQTYLIFSHSTVCTTLTLNRLFLHIYPPPFLFLMGRSLVEDDDAQMMKVSLGCSEMGLSSHLQASKTGNTRFFTSNTHSSVVLQVSVCDYTSLTKRRGGASPSVTLASCHTWEFVCLEETVKVISAVIGSLALAHTWGWY